MSRKTALGLLVALASAGAGAVWALVIASDAGAPAMILTCVAIAAGSALAPVLLRGRRRTERWSSRKTFVIVGSAVALGYALALLLADARDEVLAPALGFASGFVVAVCVVVTPRQIRLAPAALQGERDGDRAERDAGP